MTDWGIGPVLGQQHFRLTVLAAAGASIVLGVLLLVTNWRDQEGTGSLPRQASAAGRMQWCHGVHACFSLVRLMGHA